MTSHSVPDAAHRPVIRPVIGMAGIGLSLLSFWLVVRMEGNDQSGLPTGMALYYHVVFILLLLIVGNASLRGFAPRHVATPAELLCLYSMMALGSGFASWEMLATVIRCIAWPAYWKATGAPDMAGVVGVAFSSLPSWVLVQEPSAALQLFRGVTSTGGHFEPAGWVAALTFWGLLLVVTLLMAQAAGRLLFSRWRDEERLTFPLVSLPLAMTEANAPLWRDRLLWIGFAAALSLDLWNGAAQLFPGLPALPVKVTAWSPADVAPSPATFAISPLFFTFHPMMIAFALLLPTDLLFSCWFFYLIGIGQRYLAGTFNAYDGSPYQFGDNFPGLNEQNAGAMFLLAAVTLYNARAMFRNLWRGDNRYDVSVLAGGTLLWMIFLLLIGIPLLLAALCLVLAAAMCLIIARLRAEMGLPVHNMQFLGPELMLPSFFGTANLSTPALTGMAAIHGLLRSHQGDPMPHLMEAQYLASRTTGDTDGARGVRQFTGYVLLAGIVCALVGPWIYTVTVAGQGLENGPNGYETFPGEGWTWLNNWLNHPKPPDLRALGLTALGALVAGGLVALRGVWSASPFHPLGYAICGMWGLTMIVVPLFLAWLIKTLALRYGGLPLFRRLLFLAYGVILGECVAGMFWTTLSVLLNQPTYRIWLF